MEAARLELHAQTDEDSSRLFKAIGKPPARAPVKKFLRAEPVCLVTPKGHRFTIIKQFCKGCRICVDFCPTGTLDLDDRFKVTLLNPDRCIGCRMCELRCPDAAIYVRKGERAEGVKGREAEAKSQSQGGVRGERQEAMVPSGAGDRA